MKIVSCDGSKIMKWEPNENGGSWNIMAAIIFELRITVMLYVGFQRGIVPHEFHICAAFFKTVGDCRNATLKMHHCVIDMRIPSMPFWEQQPSFNGHSF